MKRTESNFEYTSTKRQKLETGSNIRPGPSIQPAISEWDDDLEDQLEEVCIIAELTQQTIAVKPIAKPRPSTLNGDRLSAENARLAEAIKTKEGEVGILRSQLKQTQISKQNEALNNKRNLEKLEEQHKNSIATLRNQIEALQGEVEFKHLEVSGLLEKCKQLEAKPSGVKFRPPNPPAAFEEKKQLFSLSQAITNSKPSKINAELESEPTLTSHFTGLTIEQPENEGAKLGAILNSSFFKNIEEPTVIPMYPSNGLYMGRMDYSKSDKYKWVGLPRHVPKIHLLQPILVDMMKSDKFTDASIKEVTKIVLEIMTSLVEILKFLSGLSMNLNRDKELLASLDLGKPQTIGDLVSNELLNPTEKAVEARRAMGVICCIARSCDLVPVIATYEFISALHQVSSLVRKLCRPLEFSGVCLGIVYFLQSFLSIDKKKMRSNLLDLSRNILSEIILSRPKLEVLRQILLTLSAGAHHFDLAAKLCTKSPPESSTVYMDSKLQQALFITEAACPMKLLQIQIKTQAHLSNSVSILLSIIESFLQWLHSLLSRSYRVNMWLIPDEDMCCNPLECLCYLLTLFVPYVANDFTLLRVLERGLFILKNCCKRQRRKLKPYTLKLLPFTLRGSPVLDRMSSKGKDAAFFLFGESDGDVSVTVESLPVQPFNCSNTS